MTADKHRRWCDPACCKHETWVRRDGTARDGWWHRSMPMVASGMVIYLDQLDDEEVFCRITGRVGIHSTFRIDDLLALAQAARQLVSGKNLEPRGLPQPPRSD